MPRPRPPLDDQLDAAARRLTGAAPEPEPDVQAQLAHIAELSRNARATWFALIGLCLFVGVTLLGHEDADFFAYGAETRLPLVNVDIPVRSFFIFAPVLVAALYIYLHLYLMSLWDALADAPAQIDGAPLADRVYPWLISHAALWYRNRVCKDNSTSPRALGWVVVGVSILLGWLFGAVVLFFLWFRSLPAHEEGLTLWIAACLWAAAVVGHTGYDAASARIGKKSSTAIARMERHSRWLAGTIAALLAFLSWETTEGGILVHARSGEQVFPLYPADLREAVLIAKPDGWLPYDRWLKEFAKTYRAENGIDQEAELTPPQLRAFWATAKQEWAAHIAALTRLDLRGRDLRNADMTRAVLPRADLRGAQLDGALLVEAMLQGADFSCWTPGDGRRHCSSLTYAALRDAEIQGGDLSGARLEGTILFRAKLHGANLRDANAPGIYLSRAQLQGADLVEAQMQGADLVGAQMQGADFGGAELQDTHLSRAQMQGAVIFETNLQRANLRQARMQGADLGKVELQGADLGWVQMQGTDLSGAEMQGADLIGAQMQGANLGGAQMQGAYLGWAKMQRANLRFADMLGADLSGAQMQDAECDLAFLRGALLTSANVNCRHLAQWQLELSVGNSRTVLPDGLTVASCLNEAQPNGELREALTHHPLLRKFSGLSIRPSRADIRNALLCDPAEKPHATGSWPFEQRYWDR